VVGVVVRDGDAAGAAAPLDLRRDRLDVRGQSRPGIDDPRGVAAEHPRVRTGQRQRGRVVRAHQRDIVARDHPAATMR
jgi:hypothetical protein